MKPNSFDIFISHAAVDERLARHTKELLSDVLGLEGKRIFCSSDGQSLEIGPAFDEQVVAAHQQAKAVLALITPNSLFRPWVLMEMAAAHFRKPDLLRIMRANGVTPECIPCPFNGGQSGDLASKDDIFNLCESLGVALACKPKQVTTEMVQQIVSASSVEKGADWACVKPALRVEQGGASPFSFTEILKRKSRFAGRRKVYFFGRDLSMLKTEFRNLSKAKEAIYDWLKGEQSREFRITLFVSGKGNQETTQILRDWKQDGPLSTQCSFKARLSPVPLQDVIVVDPRDKDGYAVFCITTPDNKSGGRLQFVLGRRDGPEFMRFWKDYREQMLKSPEI